MLKKEGRFNEKVAA